MSKKSKTLLPSPNCADAYTDKLKSSQQSKDSKHSLTLSQAVNHPYFLPTHDASDKYHKAVEVYEMGASIQNLADYYKITRQAMWKILKRRNCKFRDNLRYGEVNHFYRGTLASDKAQNQLEQAITEGKIVRQTICEECGKSGTFKNGRTMIQAHHPDYSKPLEVMWLCQKCHHQWHKKFTAKEVIITESCLQQGSRNCASPSAKPDEERARTTTVTSGLKLLPLSKPSSPIGCCLRTLLASSVWYSPIVRLEWQAKSIYSVVRMTKSAITTPSAEESSETSDKQGMKQFGLLYQLAPSARPTDETECGLLPTAQGRDWKGACGTPATGSEIDLPAKIAMLPSPQTMDAIGMTREVTLRAGSPRIKSNQGIDGQAGLRDVVAMCPTPRASDYKGASNQIVSKGRNPETNSLMDCVEQPPTGKRTGMKLQPAFVEWMQGYPIGWTDLKHSETP
jgi:predicted DNA-binding protein YlxM (UPF0122 family)